VKYKLTPKERFKPIEYLITNDERIIWATENYKVWLGEPIMKFLAWVERRDIGECSPVGVECTIPRITRSTQTQSDD